MDFRTAFALGCGLAFAAVFAGWRGARPPNPMRGPRMIPWRFLMVLTAVGALVILAQAARLAGLGAHPGS